MYWIINNSDQQGFTLLELMFVAMVVGISSMIAVSVVSKFKRKAYDTAATKSVQMVAQAEELYYMDHNRYISCDSKSDCLSRFTNIKKLNDELVISVTTADGTYTVTGYSPKGTGRVVKYNSNTGIEFVDYRSSEKAAGAVG